jgi:hypothetical protein
MSGEGKAMIDRRYRYRDDLYARKAGYQYISEQRLLPVRRRTTTPEPDLPAPSTFILRRRRRRRTLALEGRRRLACPKRRRLLASARRSGLADVEKFRSRSAQLRRRSDQQDGTIFFTLPMMPNASWRRWLPSGLPG